MCGMLTTQEKAFKQSNISRGSNFQSFNPLATSPNAKALLLPKINTLLCVSPCQLRHGVGCHNLDKPTYVYPAELKQLIRAAFPEDICDYHDPQHQNVNYTNSFITNRGGLVFVTCSLVPGGRCHLG